MEIDNIDHIYPPTEGELFIALYFDEIDLDYRREVDIEDLTHDDKTIRRADFYLPDLDMYVEFLGRWNNSKNDRQNYREKVKVFSKNKIPCVYLYPENLGNIKYIFGLRARQLLVDLGRNDLVRKLNYIESVRGLLSYILIFVIAAVLGYLLNPYKITLIFYLIIAASFLLIVLYKFITLSRKYNKYLIRRNKKD